MQGQYGFQIPSELVKHVTSICGERGVRWLAELPATIAELESEWSITIGEPFEAGEFNFVARALDNAGGRVVIKIAPPYERIEIFGEAAFLQTRDGLGAVRLIAEHRDRRAIMIEHAAPGINLAELFKDDKAAAVAPAIEVLRSISMPASDAPVGTTTLDDWFSGLRRAESTAFPSTYAKKALQIYGELSADSDRDQYLHGDFHHGNIVSATRSRYLAIDPKAIIGHIGYDISVFLNNHHWWQKGVRDLNARLGTAIDQFSEAFQLDPYEIRRWAYAGMVLGAWWSFEDMPEHYDNAVAAADIWSV
jgi:streptomycin 6-kinase